MWLLVSHENIFDTIYLQMMSGKTLSLSLLCCCVCSVSHSSRGLSGSLEEEKMEARERSNRAELCAVIKMMIIMILLK